MIPYGRQAIDNADIEAVVQVLTSDFLTQGPRIEAFEKAISDYLRSGSGDAAPIYTVATNSATSALHVACMALDVGPGDLVWTCANSFAASSNCALYCGADVDFVDIDPLTLNISVPALSAKLAQARTLGRLPKVVVPVDFAGKPAPLAAIRALADEYGFKILEDASHAIGSQYQGRLVGSHGLADITVFSFHPVKIITTAEGGMAATHNAELARRMGMLRSHGITRDAADLVRPDMGGWYYEQLALGYNYRLTELQAALGISQLVKIDAFIAARHALRTQYQARLQPVVQAGLIQLQAKEEPGELSALHLYPVQVLPASGTTRREVYDSLRAAGIGVNVHYIPIYLHPYYERLGFKQGLCPAAELYYNQAISLPMHPSLTDAELAHVTDSLARALA